MGRPGHIAPLIKGASPWEGGDRDGPAWDIKRWTLAVREDLERALQQTTEETPHAARVFLHQALIAVDLAFHRINGTPPENITPWSSDHTSLVHELWRAQNQGIIAQDVDCDLLAQHIMRSEWMRAVRQHEWERGNKADR